MKPHKPGESPTLLASPHLFALPPHYFLLLPDPLLPSPQGLGMGMDWEQGPSQVQLPIQVRWGKRVKT